jgi:ABC-type Fe3+-siderophore transport system permease subunit
LLGAVGIAAGAGFALSVALHFINHGEFGFSWIHPTIFVGAAVVGFLVYFVIFFLSLRTQGGHPNSNSENGGM